ncbi:MAG: hypothetical protein IT548_03945 [Alphaproteobacteria bacterium]|nr:hypothetical protein [Alphaproteobacteria bacterium]
MRTDEEVGQGACADATALAIEAKYLGGKKQAVERNPFDRQSEAFDLGMACFGRRKTGRELGEDDVVDENPASQNRCGQGGDGAIFPILIVVGDVDQECWCRRGINPRLASGA